MSLQSQIVCPNVATVPAETPGGTKGPLQRLRVKKGFDWKTREEGLQTGGSRGLEGKFGRDFRRPGDNVCE